MWPAIVIRGFDRVPSTVIDISRFGAKVKSDKPVHVGETVTVSCQHFGIEGVIAWCKASLAGIKFNRLEARFNPFLAQLPLSEPPRFGRRS